MAQLANSPQRLRVKLIAAALLAACTVCTLGGCVYSSVITEVVHVEDESAPIDENADPIYVNSVQADMISDQIPSLVPMTEGVRQLIEGMPTFEGDLSHSEVRESREGIEEFLDAAESSSRNGSRWSSGDGSQRNQQESSGRQTTSGRSWVNDVATKTNNQVAVSHVAAAQGSSGGTRADQGDTTDPSGGSGSGSSGNGTGEQTNQGGGSQDANENAGDNGSDPNAPSNVGRNPGSTFRDIGAIDDVPEGVRTVAAVGNAAVVVAALGGADGDANLVAADADLLSGNAQAVLSGRSIGSATALWAGSGNALGQADIAGLTQLAPDAVVVSDGEATLSEDEVTALTESGTNVVFVPNMSSRDNTVQCVQRIGALLGKGGDSTAQNLANRYESFVQEMESYSSETVDSYTVYVSNWVVGVQYLGSVDVPVGGVAFASTGSRSQPLGEYLRAAGVLNTGSYKSPYNVATANAIVWPFNGATWDNDWSGISNVNGGITQGNGFDLALTFASPYNNADRHFLGDASFHYLLTRTKAIADAIEGDKAGGVLTGGRVDSSIISNEYEVLVNPHGMFSSWATGSMESCLEIPWAHKWFKANGNDGGSFDRAVSSFYSEFYGYNDADVSGIESGAYAG